MRSQEALLDNAHREALSVPAGDQSPASAEPKHTPLPWLHTAGHNSVAHISRRADGFGDIATVWGLSKESANADAELIVRAVNSHADMLAALRGLTNCADGLSFAEAEVREAVGNTNWSVLQHWIKEARIAIAKAEGR